MKVKNMYKYKIGDRIKVVNDQIKDIYNGLTGTIVYIDRGLPFPLEVEFDEQLDAECGADSFKPEEIRLIEPEHKIYVDNGEEYI